MGNQVDCYAREGFIIVEAGSENGKFLFALLHDKADVGNRNEFCRRPPSFVRGRDLYEEESLIVVPEIGREIDVCRDLLVARTLDVDCFRFQSTPIVANRETVFSGGMVISLSFFVGFVLIVVRTSLLEEEDDVVLEHLTNADVEFREVYGLDGNGF